MNLRDEVLALITAACAAAFPYVRAWVLSQLTSTRLAHVRDIARVAVRGAEKLGNDLAPLLPEGVTSGAEKEKLAADAITAGAKRFGVKLSESEVLVILHEALREMEQLATAAV